jgi:wobble nucleotide-excising tRNase
LKKIFDSIDKAIGSNVELRAFKKVIENDNSLLVQVKDYELFKKQVWLGYLSQMQVEIKSLLEFFSLKKDELSEIIKQAASTATEWESAAEEFNTRFSGLPFKIVIKNKEDVILKTNTPVSEFIFNDTDKKKIRKDELLRVLSQGERRALYILNIIFEIRARKKANQKTLLIVDDIADSFDYKNKYAIIEYLKDISEDDNFFQIILTHNFDFFS